MSGHGKNNLESVHRTTNLACARPPGRRGLRSRCRELVDGRKELRCRGSCLIGRCLSSGALLADVDRACTSPVDYWPFRNPPATYRFADPVIFTDDRYLTAVCGILGHQGVSVTRRRQRGPRSHAVQSVQWHRLAQHASIGSTTPGSNVRPSTCSEIRAAPSGVAPRLPPGGQRSVCVPA